MTIAFVGNSFLCSNECTKETVKEIIRNSISNTTNVICYLSGYGDFDEMCARACRELKREYNYIELVYASLYLSL